MATPSASPPIAIANNSPRPGPSARGVLVPPLSPPSKPFAESPPPPLAPSAPTLSPLLLPTAPPLRPQTSSPIPNPKTLPRPTFLSPSPIPSQPLSPSQLFRRYCSQSPSPSHAPLRPQTSSLLPNPTPRQASASTATSQPPSKTKTPPCLASFQTPKTPQLRRCDRKPQPQSKNPHHALPTLSPPQSPATSPPSFPSLSPLLLPTSAPQPRPAATTTSSPIPNPKTLPRPTFLSPSPIPSQPLSPSQLFRRYCSQSPSPSHAPLRPQTSSLLPNPTPRQASASTATSQPPSKTKTPPCLASFQTPKTPQLRRCDRKPQPQSKNPTTPYLPSSFPYPPQPHPHPSQLFRRYCSQPPSPNHVPLRPQPPSLLPKPNSPPRPTFPSAPRPPVLLPRGRA